eukprot:529483-Rhodomonas_salina.1
MSIRARKAYCPSRGQLNLCRDVTRRWCGWTFVVTTKGLGSGVCNTNSSNTNTATQGTHVPWQSWRLNEGLGSDRGSDREGLGGSRPGSRVEGLRSNVSVLA